MGRWALPCAASCLALVVWFPLAVARVPLDTHDGFLHLGWAVGWAGAGTFVLAMYPPLFRLLVGVPLVTSVSPDHAVAGALLVLLLLNAGGALALARVWLPAGP